MNPYLYARNNALQFKEILGFSNTWLQTREMVEQNLREAESFLTGSQMLFARPLTFARPMGNFSSSPSCFCTEFFDVLEFRSVSSFADVSASRTGLTGIFTGEYGGASASLNSDCSYDILASTSWPGFATTVDINSTKGVAFSGSTVNKQFTFNGSMGLENSSLFATIRQHNLTAALGYDSASGYDFFSHVLLQDSNIDIGYNSTSGANIFFSHEGIYGNTNLSLIQGKGGIFDFHNNNGRVGVSFLDGDWRVFAQGPWGVMFGDRTSQSYMYTGKNVAINASRNSANVYDFWGRAILPDGNVAVGWNSTNGINASASRAFEHVYVTGSYQQGKGGSVLLGNEHGSVGLNFQD